MRAIDRIPVPTGDILVVKGQRGRLEMLSIGDYGKEVNLKCDALGLSRDIERVTHTTMLPLTQKWVITISTQYGCEQRCTFCDVPRVPFNGNATKQDLIDQVRAGMSLHPEITHSDRLNIHFARMGEPTWNPDVLAAARWMRTELPGFKVHPVVSTMMPGKNPWLDVFVGNWMDIKNNVYGGNAGLQISVNSTDDAERDVMFRGQAAPLSEIARIVNRYPPKGRKITLNFAVAGYTIDPSVLIRLFSPERYIIKLTPMHKTKTALMNGIETEGDYTTITPYKEDEERLKAAGYDVLVFVASVAEDLGRITCGNAILAGTRPEKAAWGDVQ